MSWFSDLTDKAGALLNRVDQVAAASLQEVGISSPSKNTNQPVSSTTSNETFITPSYWANQKERGATVAQVLVGSATESPLITPTSRHYNPASSPAPSVSGHVHSSFTSTNSFPVSSNSSTPNQSNQLVTEDSLFEFLNSPKPSRSRGSESNSSSKKKSAIMTPIYTNVQTRCPHSSTESPSEKEAERKEAVRNSPLKPDVDHESDLMMAALVTKTTEKEGKIGDGEEQAAVAEEIDFHEVDDRMVANVPTAEPEHEHEDEVCIDKEVQASSSVAATELEKWKQTISNLDLENKMMKREVASLNEELGGVMTRLSEASQNSAHYQSENHALREQASQSDHMIRQLRSHDVDLQAAVEAQELQIQVLRTQLALTDKAVEEKKEQYVLAMKEQERLLQDASLSSGAHDHALESVKMQLLQVESQLASVRKEHMKEKTLLMERENVLQEEKLQLSSGLTIAERQVAAERGKVRDYQATMQNLQKELQLLKNEHVDYKKRAAGILQAKDKLICSLQGGGEEGEGVGGAEEARVEEVRLEKEHLQAQLTKTLRQLEEVKKDMQELAERSNVEVESVVEQVRVCEGVLEVERRQRVSAHEDLTRLGQELQLLREDLVRERNMHRGNVQAKENELSNLKVQIAASVTPGREELEVQLSQLTASLIQKQTTLETLNSERSTLHVQLQRMQAELAQAKKTTPNNDRHQTAVRINSLEQTNEALHIPSIDSVMTSLDRIPLDSRLHNVRRAVNRVDRISIRLGMFLKRYPQARLITLFYVLLLHLWVMFVLLTYSPESHDHNDPRLQTPL